MKIITRDGKECNLEAVMHSIGAGWHDLVRRLVKDLYALGWDGHLLQIKEKFGGLRFYIGQGSPEIYARISQAEAESYKTCEECGAEGSEATINGWLATRCETHKMRT